MNESAALDREAVQAKIRKICWERANGGPDRSDECFTLAARIDWEAETIDLVDQAEAEFAKRMGPKPEQNEEAARGSFFCDAAQPRVEEPEGQPKSETETRQEDPRQTWPMPPFAKEEAVNNGEAPLLSVSTPYESAREYVRRHCTIGRLSGLYFHGGEFWRWNGRFYEIKSEDSVRSDVYEFLNGADRRVNTDGGVTQTHFNPNPRQVSAVIDGLKSGLFFERNRLGGCLMGLMVVICWCLRMACSMW